MSQYILESTSYVTIHIRANLLCHNTNKHYFSNKVIVASKYSALATKKGTGGLSTHLGRKLK